MVSFKNLLENTNILFIVLKKSNIYIKPIIEDKINNFKIVTTI